MPELRTIQRARRDARAGKSPSTQAGEFVREEMEHIRHGKHGARSTKQAIAIGLSKARRAGVPLKPPARGKVSDKSRRSAQLAYAKGKSGAAVSKKRSTARRKALQKESHYAATRTSLSRHAHTSAHNRTAAQRSAAAKKAAVTKGAAGRSAAARKAATTRATNKPSSGMKNRAAIRATARRSTARRAAHSRSRARASF